MRSILQDWVMELPLRHQGVLMSATRGCDTTPKPMVAGDAPVERWLSAYLRYTFMIPADERELEYAGAFMNVVPPHSWKASELGHLPQHFYAHLMHAFQVVAVHHPQHHIALECRVIYEKMVNNLHLMPELDSVMEERLTVDRIATGTVVS